MVAGKQQQPQQQGMVVAAKPGVVRRLWRVVSAVLDMLRRDLSLGRKLAMDLLLLHHRKITGRALGEIFLAFHHGNHGRHSPTFSCIGASANSSVGVGPSHAARSSTW